MKYTFHIVDVFSSTPFGGNQLAVLPDASGISTEGMQKIAREFNFGETTFVLPKKDPANTCRVRIFSPRAELDFAGHPTVGTACALVMKQHVRLSDPIRLILEENVGPVTVDVAQRNGAFHGTLTLSGKIETPTGAPSLTDLAAVLSIEPAEVSQVLFAGVGLPFCFAQLNSNEVVDRAAINRAAWAATLARAWSPHVFFFAGNLRDGGKLYARMCAPALGVQEDLDRQRLCRPRRGNGIEARFWRDRLSPFDRAGRLDGAPKRYRSGSAEARRRGDLCQRWRRNNLHRKR
jgi:trans-2,3-dihydro-3-hydroxyanthranilate isomerase